MKLGRVQKGSGAGEGDTETLGDKPGGSDSDEDRSSGTWQRNSQVPGAEFSEGWDRRDRPSLMSPGTVPSRYLGHWQVGGTRGAVVAIDVIRAFTTSAYAFSRGARAIYLVETVEEALLLKRDNYGWLAMGEDRGLKQEGFDFANSPVALSRAELTGRTLVQRTSAGTRGALAAKKATRLWCASLVNASATARAVLGSRLGPPTYVVTGRTRDGKQSGDEDVAVAHYIERARTGQPLDPAFVAREVAESDDAIHTLKLGPEHVHPDDIAYAIRVDAFDFAMEAHRDSVGLRLSRVDVGR